MNQPIDSYKSEYPYRLGEATAIIKGLIGLSGAPAREWQQTAREWLEREQAIDAARRAKWAAEDVALARTPLHEAIVASLAAPVVEDATGEER